MVMPSAASALTFLPDPLARQIQQGMRRGLEVDLRRHITSGATAHQKFRALPEA